MTDQENRPGLPQIRLWILDRMVGGLGNDYVIPFGFNLKGILNTDALRQALCCLVDRHDSLRMVFPDKDGEVRLELLESYDPLRISDHAGEKDFDLETLRQEILRGFDLSKGPLFRVILASVSEHEHYLLGNIHHIVSDGWSQGVLLQELQEAYRAFCAGQSPALEELPMTYRQYMDWQRRRLEGGELARQYGYWHEQLKNAPPVLDLSGDRPRPVRRGDDSGRIQLVLDSSLSHGIRQLSRQASVTPYMLLLAVFSILLYRYSGQRDVLVGSPIANRLHPDSAGVIGFFVNTLVLRTDVRGDEPFADLLQRVRNATLDAYDNQEVPFDYLVERLKPERSLSVYPLIQVMFAFQNLSEQDFGLEGLESESLKLDKGGTKFDLSLMLHEKDGEFVGRLGYAKDMFDEATAIRMADHFQRLLGAVVTEPETPVGNLKMLSEQERRQILVEWNKTDMEFPQDSRYEQLFKATAARIPDEIAYTYEGCDLTYAEVDQKSDALASRLQELGVRPGDFVPVLMHNCLEVPLSFLAIMKSGAAFVPLGNQWPVDWLNAIFEEISCDLVLVNSETSTISGLSVEPELVDTEFLQMPTVFPQVEGLSSDNPLYVMFTSGTTGLPKGVVIPHRSFVNYCFARPRYFEFREKDRILLSSSPVFDPTLSRYFMALLVGGRLIIAHEHATYDVLKLLSYLEEYSINEWNMVPSMLNSVVMLFECNPALVQKLRSLKRLTIGGEELFADVVRRFLGFCPWVSFFNMYGPAEVTIGSVGFPIPSSVPEPMPIGRPIANIKAIVADERLELTPIGVKGELLLGGEGVGLGYLNNPEATQRVFVPNPYPELSCDRLYRTGDIVSQRPNGLIDFHGRIDHQVKLRGMRVELGEIESVLDGEESVRRSIVVVRESEIGKSLVAYIEPSRDEPDIVGWTDQVKVYLEAKLPTYMVPSTIVKVDHFSETNNGKIDRSKLPNPIAPISNDDNRPFNDTEQRLSGVWCQLLDIDFVPKVSGFFDLGGHSLLLTRLGFYIEREFSVTIPLTDLYKNQSLIQQSRLVDQLTESTQAREASKTRQSLTEADNAEVDLPGLPQTRLWILDRLVGVEGDPLLTGGLGGGYIIPFGFSLKGILNVEALRLALCHLVIRHDGLRMIFPDNGGEPCLELLEPYDPLEVKTYPGGEEFSLDALKTKILRKFKLSEGPLFRMILASVSEHEHYLLGSIHHIISDGWSQDILYRELGEAYRSFCDERTPVFEELPITYQQYMSWQRQRMEEGESTRQLSYWREQLKNVPPVLELPGDRPRSVQRSDKAGWVQIVLDEVLTHSVKQLANKASSTVFMMLLSVFSILLYRYSGQRDILIGTPIANRGRPESFGLIGFFLNTLVLRTNVHGDEPFVGFLQRVRSMALDAYENQDVPFDSLVEHLNPRRSLGYHPLFQVMFIFQKVSEQRLDLPEIALESVSFDTLSAKFDLTLAISEHGEQFFVNFNYACDLFDRSTIEHMAGHFKTLLAAVVEQPECPVARLPLLTKQEERQLLTEWNGVERDAPPINSLQQMFENQAANCPDKVALEIDERQLSYRELNLSANRMAHQLVGAGVGPNVLVGLFVGRCEEMIVGLLAIVKAGGAYVPLDPEFPDERVSQIIDESGLKQILTTSDLENRLDRSDLCTLVFEQTDVVKSTLNSENPMQRSTAGDLLYVLYTSGSTGVPKGVAMPQRALINLIFWQEDFSGFSNSLRVLQYASLNFDVSCQEIFTAFKGGGTLVLVEDTVRRDSRSLLRFLHEKRIQLLFLPYVALSYLVDAVAAEAIPRELCTIITAGEQLHITPAMRNFFASGACRLQNQYGPTESHVVTAYMLSDNVTDWMEFPPIGRPIANARIYILDSNLQPVPVGIPGELYIGGECLAQGYLGKEDLTRERFAEVKGLGRLYRTGDLGCWRPEGVIDFIGRMDNQIKLRGFRIELGEIESILSQQKQVELAVAEVCGAGEHRFMVAHVVLDRNAGESWASELMAALKLKLPNYMIPAKLYRHDNFPVNVNGKIDRTAVLIESGTLGVLSSNTVKPRNPTEHLLLDIWKQIIEPDCDISVDDNFFDIGGHSLLAVKLVSRIEREIGRHVPTAALFNLSTIAEFAAFLDSDPEMVGVHDSKESEQTVGQSASVSSGEAEILHIQYGYISGWRGHRANADSMIMRLGEDDHPVKMFWCGQEQGEIRSIARVLQDKYVIYSMRSNRFMNAYGMEAVRVLGQRYVIEIRRLQPNGPYFLGSYCLGAKVIAEFAWLLIDQGQEIGHIFILEGHQHVFGEHLLDDQVPLTLVLGRESELNPYKRFRNPGVGLQKVFPGLREIVLVPSGHGFSAAALRKFSHVVRSVVGEREEPGKGGVIMSVDPLLALRS